MQLGLVVEGHGEVEAAPALFRRIALYLDVVEPLNIPRPFRLQRGRLVQQVELLRAAEVMSRRVSPDGAIVVLFDADDDAPCDVGPRLKGWLQARFVGSPCFVVAAKQEFENWIIASIDSLGGIRGVPAGLSAPANVESIADAKGWLDSRLSNGYSPTIDQAALAANLDVGVARTRSTSLDKLVRDIAAALA